MARKEKPKAPWGGNNCAGEKPHGGEAKGGGKKGTGWAQ